MSGGEPQETGVVAAAEDAVRVALERAEQVIGASLDLVARAGAAQWAAFFVPHESDSWRVAVATGAGAPDVGTVWSPDDVLRFTETTTHRHTPAGLLCAAPHEEPADNHHELAEALHTLIDHLHALVTHHVEQVATTSATVAETGAGAPTDTATGLLTRELVLNRLHDEVARAKRYGGGLSTLLCDLDGLDAVAAVASEAGRDAVLAAVGAAMRRHLRQMDCAGRYDDRSLLIVLPETGADEAMRAAMRLARFVAEAVTAVELGVASAPAVVLRMGASTYPAPARSADDLLAQSAAALQAVTEADGDTWLAHAADEMNESPLAGFKCVCRRCGNVFRVLDRAQQRARRFCSHECYTIARREGGQERDHLIRQMRAEGQSLRSIARRFGLSAERVRQILEAQATAV